jgi:hypothetical protein
MTYIHCVMLATLAACSMILAYAAHTQPHPAHLAIAFVIAWALIEVCINIYHKEKNK